MNSYKLHLFITSFMLISLIILPVTAQSTIIADEDFESYSTGNLNGNNGGTGWGGAWSVNNSQAVVSANLSYSITDGATIDGGNNALAITTNNNTLLNRLLSSSITDTVYVRYLLQWSNGTIDTNDFVATGVRQTNGNYNTSGVFGLKSNEGPSNQDFFVRPTSSASNNTYTSDQLAVGTTYLIVVRYTKGATNFDQMDMWVNPSQGDEASPEATQANNIGISAINYFGARTANIGGETILIDEIVISEKWDDVVPPAPEVEFASSTGSGAEASTVVPQLVFNYDGGTLTADETVTVTVTGGSATTGDYTNTTTVTIPMGTSDGDLININFATTDDSDVEGDEDVEFTLSAPSGDLILGTQDTFTYTVTDDDAATVAFDTAGTVTTDETVGAQSINVSLVINGTDVSAGTLQNGDVTVDVELQATGTATDGTDFATFTTETITFTDGSEDTTETVDVTVTDDSEVEGDETVDLALTNISANGTLGANTAHTVTITDDDTATFNFALADSTTAQEDTAGTHTVDVSLILAGTTATAPSLKNDATINVVDSSTGTASALDYTFVDTLLTFSITETQSVDVTILADTEEETGETVILGLSSPSANAGIGATLLHTVTIADDDASNDGDDDDDDDKRDSDDDDDNSDTDDSLPSNNNEDNNDEGIAFDGIIAMNFEQGFIVDDNFTVQVFAKNDRDFVMNDTVTETVFPAGVEITSVTTSRGTTNIEDVTLMRPVNRRALNRNRNDILQAVTSQTVIAQLGDLLPGQRAVIIISGRITSAFRGTSVNPVTRISFSGLTEVETISLRLPIINMLPQTGETPIWRTPLIILLSLMITTGISLSGWWIKHRLI